MAAPGGRAGPQGGGGAGWRPSGDRPELLDRAEAGCFRTRVALDLGVTRTSSTAPQQRHRRLVTRWRREIRSRPRRFTGGVAEDVLDDAVLARVIAQHGAPALRGEQIQSLGERTFEHGKFIVDFDADRLEGLAGRMAGVAASCGGNRIAHDLGQLTRRGDRAGGDDRTGDATGVALVAVALEDPCRVRSSLVLTRSAAVRPWLRSIRMSSGPSLRKLKPRSARSSCGELTPRSNNAPDTRLAPSDCTAAARPSKRVWRTVTRSPCAASRAPAAAKAISSRSRPRIEMPSFAANNAAA